MPRTGRNPNNSNNSQVQQTTIDNQQIHKFTISAIYNLQSTIYNQQPSTTIHKSTNIRSTRTTEISSMGDRQDESLKQPAPSLNRLCWSNFFFSFCNSDHLLVGA